MRKVTLFIKLSWNMKLLVIYSFLLTGIYRFIILFIPFKWVAGHIGKEGLETTREDYDNMQILKSVRRAVLISSNNTLWESKCLVQALTALTLLKKRHISSTLYLGLAKDEAGDLIAHAWLRVGSCIITGYSGMDKFQPITWFGYEGIKHE